MSQVFVNNGVSTLAANVSAADTTIFIQAGHVARFPTIAAPDYCFVTLENAAGALEIVKVTAHGAASASLTVVRGQQGTAALDWLTGDLVELRLTKDELNRFERAALRDGDTYSNTHDFLNATLKVKTPTTPFEAATKSFVESFLAAATAAGAAGQLPNQAGKAGAFLKTNGTLATFEFIPGADGAQVTGSTTLTATSPAAMTVTPTAPGQYATLPDATTCAKGVNLFSIYNAGEHDYGVKDAAGNQIGWVRPKTGAVIGLSANANAAGVWPAYGLEKIGVTANYSNPSLTNMGTSIVRVTVDANRTCFLFGNTDCYGIIYDASTLIWGSPILVRASVAAGAFLAILSAANQVLVASCNSTTGFAAVTLTISGTSIDVNAPVPVTLAGTFSNIGQMVQVGSSFVVSYGRATTTTALRAITVSGTVPTIGNETVIAATTVNSARLYASGSVLRTFVDNMAGGSSCLINPYTVSGTTLNLGTGTSVMTALSPRIFQIGNGNVIIQASNGNHQAHISSLSGTTETVSTATLGTAPSSIANSAYVAIGNKVVFLSAPAGSTWYANILTDTGGTASAGTQISGTVSGTTFQSVAALFSNGNTAKFAWQCSSGSSTAGTLAFDCSGSSPTLSDIKTLNGGSGGQVSYSIFLGQPLDQTRHQTALIAGTNAISIGNGVSTVYGLQVSANNISKVLLTPMRATNGVVGATNSESYFVNQVDGSTTGIAIIKMEMAA